MIAITLLRVKRWMPFQTAWEAQLSLLKSAKGKDYVLKFREAVNAYIRAPGRIGGDRRLRAHVSRNDQKSPPKAPPSPARSMGVAVFPDEYSYPPPSLRRSLDKRRVRRYGGGYGFSSKVRPPGVQLHRRTRGTFRQVLQ